MNPMITIRGAAIALAALATLEYLGVLASLGWDVSVSPFGLLLVLAVPQLAGLLLMSRRPRAGTTLIGVDCLAWVVVTGSQLVGHLGEQREGWIWTTYVMIYIGAPIGLLGLFAATAGLRSIRGARPVQ